MISPDLIINPCIQGTEINAFIFSIAVIDTERDANKPPCHVRSIGQEFASTLTSMIPFLKSRPFSLTSVGSSNAVTAGLLITLIAFLPSTFSTAIETFTSCGMAVSNLTVCAGRRSEQTTQQTNKATNHFFMFIVLR